METKQLYRILEDGEQIWQGKAWSENKALELALGEETGDSLYEIQRWGDKKISSVASMKDWIFCWRGRLEN